MVSVSFLLIGFAKADQPHFLSAHGENKSIQAICDEPICNAPVFTVVATGVPRYLRRLELEIDSHSQSDTVLGDIALVLGAIELELHDLIVYTKKSLVQCR
jgi:hypothetical protein